MARNKRGTEPRQSRDHRGQTQTAKVIQIPTNFKRKDVKLIPRNKTQEDLLYALTDPSNSIVFAVGSAGTGKTMLATQWAIRGLMEKEFDKIVISRPNIAVDDKDIGYLPGDLTEKLWPWVLPIIDVFKEYFSKEEIEMMIENDIIEFCPLAYIRGRTFKRAAIIIDEAQNTTINSMLSILTRIGDDSKMVVTGDIAQSDRGKDNGLSDFLSKVQSNKVNGISVVQFTRKDVERHPVVKEVLKLYGKED